MAWAELSFTRSGLPIPSRQWQQPEQDLNGVRRVRKAHLEPLLASSSRICYDHGIKVVDALEALAGRPWQGSRIERLQTDSPKLAYVELTRCSVVDVLQVCRLQLPGSGASCLTFRQYSYKRRTCGYRQLDLLIRAKKYEKLGQGCARMRNDSPQNPRLAAHVLRFVLSTRYLLTPLETWDPPSRN